jgi:hypothetical protein
LIEYWKWLFVCESGECGIRRFLDRWLLLHILICVILSFIVPVTLRDAANTVLLPLAGIFIGLSFAWGGNAQALLQTEEIEGMTNYHKGGFQEYVFVYQTAILLILITLILWGLAGFDIYDKIWPTNDRAVAYFIIRFVLFLFASLTVRECWQVVIGAQMMLIARYRIKNLKNK